MIITAKLQIYVLILHVIPLKYQLARATFNFSFGRELANLKLSVSKRITFACLHDVLI